MGEEGKGKMEDGVIWFGEVHEVRFVFSCFEHLVFWHSVWLPDRPDGLIND